MRLCVFCSSPGVTREHVLPRWLKAAFPAGDLLRGLHVRASEVAVHQHEQRLLDGTVRATCAGCNSGWMSDLEGQVRDFLPQMINGQLVRLAAEQLDTLATWSLKTIMMFRLTNTDPQREVIPAEDYHALYVEGRPSRYMVARLARIAPPVRGPVVLAVDFACPTFGLPDEGAFGYVATLRIGHFVVQFLRAAPLDDGQQLRRFGASAQTVPLWPAASGAIWPPPLPIPGVQWNDFIQPMAIEWSTEPLLA